MKPGIIVTYEGIRIYGDDFDEVKRMTAGEMLSFANHVLSCAVEARRVELMAEAAEKHDKDQHKLL